MAAKKNEKKKIREIVAEIYSAGYTQGLERILKEYQQTAGSMEAAGMRMRGSLEVRFDLVDKAVDGMVERLAARAKELKAKGMGRNEILADLSSLSNEMAKNKAEEISRMEFAQARFDGAGNLLNEAGEKFEWQFSHLGLGRPGHRECPVCQAIRERGPYTTEQAEAEGFPSVPHPNCDHGWIVVPLGDQAKAEQFPPTAKAAGVSKAMTRDVSMDEVRRVMNAQARLDTGWGVMGIDHGLLYVEEDWGKFDEFKEEMEMETTVEEELDLDLLHATQPAVIASKVDQYVPYVDDPDQPLPLVVKYRGTLYVVDGHHRLAAAIFLDRMNVKVRVVERDWAYGSRRRTENALGVAGVGNAVPVRQEDGFDEERREASSRLRFRR